jgi:asparagine synthase (glutamine-hydrolysing)
MCGIAGIIDADERLVSEALPRMVDAQRHRGPDDSGLDLGRLGSLSVGLGHTRLAIIDLSAAGHQPMIHPETGGRLIYNGELYDVAGLRSELEARGHVFRGHSDTEILLAGLVAWGPSYLSRIKGMFALAFHDVRRGRVILARDSIGIKPLYLAASPAGWVFASEVRAILATGRVPPALDRRGLASMLAYGAVQRPSTLFRGIGEVPPGHYQVISAEGAAAPRPFWSPPLPRAVESRELVPAVRTTVDAAVRDHLIADVPVGLFLSSGLDSTIMAGVAARHASRLRSFTVGFGEDPQLSEMELAAETARLFGLDHTRIDVTAADAEAATVRWLDALDLPSVDGFNVSLISQVVRREGMTVALSGQGGDELFGGYPTFADVPRLSRVFRGARLIPRGARQILAAAATGGRPDAVRAKAHDIAGSDGSLVSLYLQRRRLMSSAQLEALGLFPPALELTPDYMPPEGLDEDLASIDDPVCAVSRLETRLYLGNMLLRDGDANGMSHSLEIRVPFLDQRLLDLMLPVPGAVRLPERRADKHLLRAAFPELLRPALRAQSKRGFTLPVGRWMRGPLRPLCEAALGVLRSSGALIPAGVDSVWNAFLREPESPAWSRAFALCVVGHYLGRQTAPA